MQQTCHFYGGSIHQEQKETHRGTLDRCYLFWSVLFSWTIFRAFSSIIASPHIPWYRSLSIVCPDVIIQNALPTKQQDNTFQIIMQKVILTDMLFSIPQIARGSLISSLVILNLLLPREINWMLPKIVFILWSS